MLLWDKNNNKENKYLLYARHASQHLHVNALNLYDTLENMLGETEVVRRQNDTTLPYPEENGKRLGNPTKKQNKTKTWGGWSMGRAGWGDKHVGRIWEDRIEDQGPHQGSVTVMPKVKRNFKVKAKASKEQRPLGLEERVKCWSQVWTEEPP